MLWRQSRVTGLLQKFDNKLPGVVREIDSSADNNANTISTANNKKDDANTTTTAIPSLSSPTRIRPTPPPTYTRPPRPSAAETIRKSIDNDKLAESLRIRYQRLKQKNARVYFPPTLLLKLKNFVAKNAKNNPSAKVGKELSSILNLTSVTNTEEVRLYVCSFMYTYVYEYAHAQPLYV